MSYSSKKYLFLSPLKPSVKPGGQLGSMLKKDFWPYNGKG